MCSKSPHCHLKYIYFLSVNYTSVKLGEKTDKFLRSCVKLNPVNLTYVLLLPCWVKKHYQVKTCTSLVAQDPTYHRATKSMVVVWSLSHVRLFAISWTEAHQGCLWDSPSKNMGVGCRLSSGGSSPPRDWARVSCIAGRFFTDWVTWDARQAHRRQLLSLCSRAQEQHPLTPCAASTEARMP